MVDRQHILNFLRVNGITSASPEDVVRAALLSARWHPHDVDIAVLKLQGHEDPYSSHGITPRYMYYTATPIDTKTLSSLLGVNISVARARAEAEATREYYRDKTPFFLFCITILTSVFLATAVMLSLMYTYNIGPFYSPVENYTF